MTATPSVVVVGGGSTGAGVARDLAQRGVDVTLVERGNLTHGTTGRMHGLLHSGARYAVADPHSARACIAENRVLREVASHCVEDTGGLFVERPADDDAYFERKLAACDDCGIPATALSGDEARAREPALADDVERAIAVPDAAVDPFRLVVANAAAAEDHGARVETHTAVTDILVDGDRVVGVEVEHGTETGERVHGVASGTERIDADHVVNATGAWAGQLAAMADCEVAMRPSKGAMVVTNVRGVDTVINRCRPKGDADILVPHETTAILGTTDEEIEDPDAFREARWEVETLIDELTELVPLLAEARTLRSFWGVRPLYEPPARETADSTDVTRQHFLLDHAERDGLEGLSTVVGGKFTTYRAMAEEVTDLVCGHLGVDRACRTAAIPLPGSEDPAVLDEQMRTYGLRSPIAKRSAERLGSRTDAVLDVDGQNPVVCACEAVTLAEVADSIDDAGADLNATRIRTRAAMGNCQGGFCCHRLAAALHPTYAEPIVRESWDDLLRERWKGQRHALWGRQLSQAALNYAMQATTQNRDRDPADGPPIDYDRFDSGPGGHRDSETLTEVGDGD